MFADNKKLAIFYILEILKEYSDENNWLTHNDIVGKLYSVYDMDYERKSVGSNIDLLIDMDYDIVKMPKGGCYLAENHFNKNEVKFLIDAVFSAKSIDGKQAKSLATKLSKFVSKYDRKNYNYIYKASEVERTANKKLFYNIEVLGEAIENGKQVSFVYNHYNEKGEIVPRKNKPYIINPYFLVNSMGKYFLVCNYDYFDEIANYKLELISDINILDSDIKPVTELKLYGNGLNISKYVNENIYMFGGEIVDATVKVDDAYHSGVIKEWFGKNARITSKNNEIIAEIRCNETALLYWCLQYGEGVEILKPIGLREKIKTKLNEVYKKYN